MPDKTKATLPGSQSINSKRIGIQITTMIGLVNLDAGNPASGTGIPVSLSHTTLSGETLRVSDADAQTHQTNRVGSVQNRLSLSESVAAGGHPFGSIPCRRNSDLASSLSQLPRLTPWRLAASFNCSRNSGVIRIWKVGDSPSPFGVLSLLMVDMYVRKILIWVSLCTYVNTSSIKIATPRTVGAVPRRLTKPLVGVTIMAELQHTQTRPLVTYNTKFFTWRFLAVPVSHPEARPIVLYTNAHTEAEARQGLPGWLLFFAARLPLFTPEIKGANHA